MKVLPVAVLALTLATGSQAADADFQRKKEAIELIDASSNNLCLGILRSKSVSYALSVDAKADLEGLIKKLASLGFNGAASVVGKKSEGFLQEDLTKVLNPQVVSDLVKCITTTSETRTRLFLGDAPIAVVKLDPLQEAKKFEADVRAEGKRISAEMHWKTPLSNECQSSRDAWEKYRQEDRPPMQTAFPDSEKEAVRQRVFEAARSMQGATNAFVSEAKKKGCLENPSDFNPVPSRR